MWSVVSNAEGQYSIWPEGRPVPDGWTGHDVSGTEAECLDHVERVWTDILPRSLREAG